MKKEENFFNKFKSPIPKHLTPEELKEWEEQMEWDQQEYERRKKEGYYSGDESKGIVSRIIQKFNYKPKKWDDPSNYGP